MYNPAPHVKILGYALHVPCDSQSPSPTYLTKSLAISNLKAVVSPL